MDEFEVDDGQNETNDLKIHNKDDKFMIRTTGYIQETDQN